MKTAEIRELSEAELQKKLRDTRDEMLNLRIRKQSGQVEDTSQFKNLRKDIARMETILAEKQKVVNTAA